MVEFLVHNESVGLSLWMEFINRKVFILELWSPKLNTNVPNVPIHMILTNRVVITIEGLLGVSYLEFLSPKSDQNFKMELIY